MTHFQSSRSLRWFLFIVGIIAVGAIVLVIRKFNGDMSRVGTDMPLNGTAPQETQNADEDTPQMSVISGFVSGVIEKPGESEKWIKVVADTSSNGDNSSMTTYQFYIRGDLKGGDSIKSGERARITFFGKPSEKEYVSVESVEVIANADKS